MNHFILAVLISVLFSAGCMSTKKINFQSPTDVAFPKASKKNHFIEKHGDKRSDPYYWMKNREDSEVIQYLNAENQIADAFFKQNKLQTEELFSELKSRTTDDDKTVPVTKKGYEYWSEIKKGHEHWTFYRKKLDTLNIELLLDEEALSKGSPYFESTGPHVSPNNEIVSYGVDTVGRRFYTHHFKNLKSGRLLDLKVSDITENLEWTEDSEHVFYVKQDPETLRANQVYRLNIKTGKSKLIFEEKDTEFSVYLTKTLSGRFLVLYSAHLQTVEAHILDSQKPLNDFKLVRPRKSGVKDENIVDSGENFVLLTNDQDKNYEAVKIGYDQLNEPSKWQRLKKKSPDLFIENIEAIKNHLIVFQKFNGLDEITLIHLPKMKSRKLGFDEKTFSVMSLVSGDFDQTAFRIAFTSPRVPVQTREVNLTTLEQKVLKTKPVPNFDPQLYKTERLFLPVRDGKSVPVSLVMRSDYTPNGKNPIYIYGYGSYGMAIKPMFELEALSLVDRGFVYAIAHIRGGNDLGRDWYDQGRMKNKMNTFTDFIDVTEALIKKGYAQSGRVYAEGASAGGLLMGAVANLRPDLYHGMIAKVPFVDVLTTMLDDTIPLTTFEYQEWGNPNKSDEYAWMRAYSPYDNVKAQSYPSMFIRSGLHDSQVQYWEPTKWIARLREMNKSNSLIILKTNMDAGHGGASGRFKRLKESSEDLSFVLWLDKKGLGRPL
jgi:oligopeptidase B